jgi:hypothetical protein
VDYDHFPVAFGRGGACKRRCARQSLAAHGFFFGTAIALREQGRRPSAAWQGAPCPGAGFRKDFMMTTITNVPAAVSTRLLSRPIFGSLILIVALALAGCATMTEGPPVTVPQIIQMSKAGTPADQIIAKIKKSGTAYRLKASQLADLKNKGVPDSVINYMQQTYLDAVRQQQAMADWGRWTQDDYGYWYGGCPYNWGEEWCR